MDAVVTWVQVLIALVGIALASLPQLTSKARLRTRIAFWTSQVQGTDLEYDRQVAESFRRDTTARLLALEAYPAWRFLGPAYVTIGGWLPATFIGSPGIRGGNDPSGFYTFWHLIAWAGLTELVRVVLSRQRIIQRYLGGETLNMATKIVYPIGQRMPVEDPRGPIKMSWLLLLALLAFSAGVYILIMMISISAWSGEGSAGPERYAPPPWQSAAFAAGLSLMTGGWYSVVKLVSREKKGWEHPRQLNEKASLVRSKHAAEPVQPRNEASWWRRGR